MEGLKQEEKGRMSRAGKYTGKRNLIFKESLFTVSLILMRTWRQAFISIFIGQ